MFRLLLWEPQQQMATGTIVMTETKDRAGERTTEAWDTTCLNQALSMFFFSFQIFTSFFNTKCLFSRDLPQWQQTATTITINKMNADDKCPPLSPHKRWAKDWAEQQKGQQGLETQHVSSPSVCFFSFFTYFLSSKYLFASRTTAS